MMMSRTIRKDRECDADIQMQVSVMQMQVGVRDADASGCAWCRCKSGTTRLICSNPPPCQGGAADNQENLEPGQEEEEEGD